MQNRIDTKILFSEKGLESYLAASPDQDQGQNEWL